MSKIIRINEITKEDLRRFEEIDRNCLAMHVCPPPKMFINMKVHMPDGELVLDYDLRAHSWVRNAYNSLGSAWLGAKTSNFPNNSAYGPGSLRSKGVGGNLSFMSTLNIWNYNGMTGGNGDVNSGIVVGAGTTAESFESTALATRIANGNGAGQLSYQAMSEPIPVYNVPTKKWVCNLARIFNNNSGGTIVIAETGIQVYSSQFQYTDYMLLCRDLLASTVSVANTAQLTVTYTIEMTFPA